MKLLGDGSGMMGSATAYDMARQPDVLAVTLADSDLKRARDVAARINRIHGDRQVKAVALDASSERAVGSENVSRRPSVIPDTTTCCVN